MLAFFLTILQVTNFARSFSTNSLSNLGKYPFVLCSPFVLMVPKYPWWANGITWFWRSLGMTIWLDFNAKLSSTVSSESVFKKCLKVLRFSVYLRKVNDSLILWRLFCLASFITWCESLLFLVAFLTMSMVSAFSVASSAAKLT